MSEQEKFPRLLPGVSTSLEKNLEGISAVSLDLLVPRIWSIEDCPGRMLPWLAWSLSVPTWNDGWTERQKRDVIASTIAVHRSNGTTSAVLQALGAVGFKVQLLEWHKKEVVGDPFTYDLRIEVDDVGFDRTDLFDVLRFVDATKSLRSHLSEVSIVSNRTAVVDSVFVASSAPVITIESISIETADGVDGGAAGTSYLLAPSLDGGGAVTSNPEVGVGLP